MFIWISKKGKDGLVTEGRGVRGLNNKIQTKQIQAVTNTGINMKTRQMA